MSDKLQFVVDSKQRQTEVNLTSFVTLTPLTWSTIRDFSCRRRFIQRNNLQNRAGFLYFSFMSEVGNIPTKEESQPLILALDTSSKFTSLAITREVQVLATFGAQLDEQRSARLWDIIAFLLDSVGLKIQDIQLFAVCVGPGGYTGLRVGMAAAKGFAAALQGLTVGITSLEAVAAEAAEAGRIFVLNNAYKGEVYSQLFSVTEEGLPVAENAAMVTGIDEALERVTGIERLLFTGDAVIHSAESIERFRQSQATICNWAIKAGSPFLAQSVARLALFKEPVKPEDLQACYVRPPDIKLKPQVQ